MPRMRTRRLAAALAATVVTGALLTACGDSTDDTSSSPGDSPTTGSTSSGTCTYTAGGTAAKKVNLPPTTPAPASSLTIATNYGNIKVSLDAGKPCTANSFTSLAKQGYFDNTKCHRVSTPQAGYGILQCGDPTATGSGGPGYTFPDELDGTESYPAGTLAMANAGADTNGSQFFLTYADSGFPPNYTVFGSIDKAGIKVLKRIAAVGTANGSPDGPPKKPVVIASVK
jgi:peptidyl-prolyl cis-trans isomerase B (cyclophilin B)